MDTAIQKGIDVKWVFFFCGQKLDNGTFTVDLSIFPHPWQEKTWILIGKYSFGRIFSSSHTFSPFFRYFICCLSLFVTIRRVTALKALSFRAVSWSKNIYVVSLMFVCVKETEKGDFDRSEFVEGCYFLQILITHRLVTWILFNKNTSFLCIICKK